MNSYIITRSDSQENSLEHYGVLGMKWGVRRYQNKDGSLTPKGKQREEKLAKQGAKLAKKGNTVSKNTKKLEKMIVRASSKRTPRPKTRTLTEYGKHTIGSTIGKEATNIGRQIVAHRLAKKNQELAKKGQSTTKNDKRLERILSNATRDKDMATRIAYNVAGHRVAKKNQKLEAYNKSKNK